MVEITNFVIRSSGRYNNLFYIDYLGLYSVFDIGKQIGVDNNKIELCYKQNGGHLSDDYNVYYFDTREEAQKALNDLLDNVKDNKKGRSIYLTEREIEYIRKALITESASSIGKNHKMQDSIFKKLNM